MALGLPIISTNVGGVPFLINDGVTGLLVNPNDSVQMSKKINKLISGEIDVTQIIKNAREKVSYYDKHIISKQWHEVIEA